MCECFMPFLNKQDTNMRVRHPHHLLKLDSTMLFVQ